MTTMCALCGYFSPDDIPECLNCSAPLLRGSADKRVTIGITGYSRLEEDEFHVVEKITKEIIDKYKPTDILVGGSHGVDKCVANVASKHHIRFRNFYPNGTNYDHVVERNMQFVGQADRIIVITKKKFSKHCDYCEDKNHEKCGGCWILKYAREHGKESELIVI